jgi:peptide/nickel transport system substrate-binding protein
VSGRYILITLAVVISSIVSGLAVIRPLPPGAISIPPFSPATTVPPDVDTSFEILGGTPAPGSPSPTVYSTYVSQDPPVADGRLYAGEWPEPAFKQTFRYTFKGTEKSGYISGYLKNDESFLYAAVTIVAEDFQPDLFAQEDLLLKLDIFFDDNDDGVLKEGEDVKWFWGLDYGDAHQEGNGYRLDEKSDGEGAGAYSSSQETGASGIYVYELKTPLASGDPQDLVSAAGKPLGIMLSANLMYEVEKNRRWMTVGRAGWPDTSPWTDAGNYGHVVLATAFSTVPPPQSVPVPTGALPASTPATSPGGTQQVYGGILRIVSSTSPQVLGYLPDMSPADTMAVFPAVEALMDVTADRGKGNGLEPVLAESVEEDLFNKTIVFHLRQGVRFHDGTEMQSDDVVWNFQQLIDAGKLQYGDRLVSVRAADDYTVVMEYREYHSLLLFAWGTTAIYSRDAWEKASAGDPGLGREWARTHVVGTGPFMLNEYVRDVRLSWVKNPDYWRPGKPYLDGIDVLIIVDSLTARAATLAGEVDLWRVTGPAELKEMESRGFIRQSSWPGQIWSIIPNTADAGSMWNDIRLRQALEYAIDKENIAAVIGQGYYQPLQTIAPEGEWGYDAAYAGREYDPARARQLLKEAGYPNGFVVDMLVQNDAVSTNAAAAIQEYLRRCGIDVNLDIADPVRFRDAAFSSGWNNLIFAYSGMDVNTYVNYMRWFNHDPLVGFASLGHPAEQLPMDERARSLTDAAAWQVVTDELVDFLADRTLVIPVFKVPAAAVLAPYVHTDLYEQGLRRWRTEEIWMDKH